MKDPVLAVFVRTDLNMSRGKIAAQVGHAVAQTMYAQGRWDNRPPYPSDSPIPEWMEKNQTKIVLAANSMEDLDKVAKAAKKHKVSYAHIYDLGKTEIEPNTATCVAVGVDSRKKVSKVTEGWKALR
jgi:PTH2 family peptidyl-tRNA hydrolase